MNIAIVGMGLIGGSLARDLKSQINVKVVGVDANEAHQQLSMELGLVDEMVDLDRAIRQSQVIVLAIPVDAIEKLLPELLNKIGDDQVITDVGSTKEFICQAVDNHPRRSRYVAAHPLAGTEYSGPNAAISHLFVGKKNIICEKDKSAEDALDLVERIFRSVGLTNLYMHPSDHDKHLAYVSHLSHVSSFMLGMTVLDIEKDESQIFNLASTGFASTVRLAKSNPKTWSAIFAKNNEHLSTALGSYIDYLQKFKKAIDDKDLLMTEALMIEANDIKKILS
jgi:prephenate dehydrogenase